MSTFTLPVSCNECGGEVELAAQNCQGSRLDVVFHCLAEACSAQMHLSIRMLTVIQGRDDLVEMRRRQAAEAI